MTIQLNLTSCAMKGDFTSNVPDTWEKEFNKIVSHDEGHFYKMPSEQDILSECKTVYEKFKNHKNFIHVGMGGSSLGPEMLVDALATPLKRKNMTFLSNIEPDWIAEQLKDLSLKESVFYFVSKSGNTMESISLFLAIKNEMQSQGIKPEQFKDHIIVCTGPTGGVLNELITEYNLTKLEIPVHLGGRFSVLSAVGALPCLFAGIDPTPIWQGAKDLRDNLEAGDFKNNLFSLGMLLDELNNKGVTQTVLMPYSSKLKKFTEWFIQLWSESLGKKKNLSGEDIFTGLTPISSIGTTDQHSQMQLFMEGPRDKFVFFLEVENQSKDYSLNHGLPFKSLEIYQNRKLTDIFKAELEGTMKAFQDYGLPHVRLSIDGINEQNLGRLIFFFEALTVVMGVAFSVNPFDQPGVEASKVNANKWLNGWTGQD
ncbi:MAG: hypothetical protein DRQ88_06745 [Epsilonproteobacteria bacterium]|nr:MAG: hypothetical protein DRQ89_02855 [Campylobacterota bacterium]RLA66412.1 MAG: hypothetical protein DRQ88_06745 [Campylobacterota bacterium]